MIELTFEDAHFQDIKSGKKTTIGKIDADLQGIKKGDTVIFFKDVGDIIHHTNCNLKRIVFSVLLNGTILNI